MIVIVDYGLGNLNSIANMLRKIGSDAVVSGRIEIIASAEKLILPGVGSFDHGMRNLAERGLIEPLTKLVLEEKVPVLGLCLGMQLMGRGSEEGRLAGLGWIDAQAVRFRAPQANGHLRVPHMGWNIMRSAGDATLSSNLGGEPRFYFVHSYHLVCADSGDVAGRTFHGYEFASAIRRENIFGVQFHPEKSHRYGMRLLENFAELPAVNRSPRITANA